MRLALFLLLPMLALADVHTASSCSTAHVQAAIDAASDGDEVHIPNGSCTWTSGISTTKQIWIRAQNYSAVSGGSGTRNVTITNNSTTVPLFTMESGDDFHVRISGIRFNEDESGDQNHIRFEGSGSKPPLLDDCYFEIKGRFGNQPEIAALAFLSLGGVGWNLMAEGVGGGVGGQCCPEGASIIISSPRAWTTASTMGAADTGGLVNVYFEDSTFRNFGQGPDVDDNGRFVMRHSHLDGVSGLTHGFTSMFGGRHVEYLDNIIETSTSNRNIAGRYFWLRAGTGVWTDNDISYDNQGYGTPILLETSDNTTPTGYPQDRQCGWGHNGTNHVADPIYLWNNTGGSTWGAGSWSSNCHEGTEVIIDDGAKPGYSKFTYPHPLRSESEPDEDPPMLSSGSPSGTISYTESASLQVATDEAATCKWDADSGTTYASMSNTFGTTGSTSHSDTIMPSVGGNTYYVRCSDGSGNANASDFTISFTMEAEPEPGSTSTRISGKISGKP